MLRLALLLACLLAGTRPPGAAAQEAGRPPGTWALGAQFSRPSGLSFKRYQQPDFASVLVAAWDLDDFLFLSLHGQYERGLEDSPLHYFAGPGLYLDLGVLSGADTVMGVSAGLGVGFFVERFEVYLQATPRLQLRPGLQPAATTGVGLRYYFG